MTVTTEQQPVTVAQEPFGYWVEQRLAEPVLLRKPAYIPEPSDLRTVTPLYTTPDATQTREAELVAENKRLRELLGDYGDKRAPVQGLQGGIPWDMHLRAYDAYSRQYSPQKSLIEGGCRGGFGIRELDMFIPGWREELEVRANAARSVPRAALNARGGA